MKAWMLVLGANHYQLSSDMEAEISSLAKNIAMPTVPDSNTDLLSDSEEVEDGLRSGECYPCFTFGVRL